MWEVFIPEKRDDTGWRFEFVRFQDVRDAQKLGKKLDQIIIGREKIHVNILRYRAHRWEEAKKRTQDENVVKCTDTRSLGRSRITPGMSYRRYLNQIQNKEKRL